MLKWWHCWKQQIELIACWTDENWLQKYKGIISLQKHKSVHAIDVVGGGGTPKGFDLSKIREKSLKIWAKSLKIWANSLNI